MFQSRWLSELQYLVLIQLVVSSLLIVQPAISQDKANQLSIEALELEDREEFQEALDTYEKSIQIRRKNPESLLKELAGDLIRAGYCSIQLQNFSEAEEYLTEALDLSKRTVDKKLQVSAQDNLGIVFELQNNFAKSIQHYKKAILIYKSLGNNSGMATDIYRIGRTFFYWGRYPEARKYLAEADKRFENVQKEVSGGELNDIIALQENCCHILVSTNLKMNNIPTAFLLNETCNSKFQGIRYSSNGKTIPPLSVDQLQLELSEDGSILVFANSNLKNPVVFTITNRKILSREIKTKGFTDRIQKKFSRELNNLRQLEPRIKWFDSPAQRELDLFGGRDFRDILSFYVSSLATVADTNSAIIQYIGRELYDLLIDPIYHEISAKNEITIIPDKLLSGIPFEALYDDTGHYLIEYHQIAYSPSAGMVKLNKQRNYSADRKPLLAIGNTYLQNSNANDNISNFSQLRASLDDMFKSPAGKFSATGLYSELGAGELPILIGGQSEIDVLQSIIPDMDALLAGRATEKQLKSMSYDGDLMDYQVLHFATNAIVMRSQPELSAIMLSDGDANSNGNDGYLRLPEIAKLKLRADLISLTHIDPGFGTRINNPGVIEIAQAFTISGAKAVSVSLWGSDQNIVNAYLSKLYEFVVEQGFNFARANTETKRYFISGAAGDEFKNPHFWASTVFHGEQAGKTFLTPPKIALLLSQGEQAPTTTKRPSKTTFKPKVEEPGIVEPELSVDEPVVDKPTFDKPATSGIDKPEVEKPDVSFDRPVLDKPTYDKPEVEKPYISLDKPVIDKPIYEKPTISGIDKPEIEKPDVSVDEPVMEKPTYEKPEVEKPDISVDKPIVNKPTYKNPEISGVDKPEINNPELSVEKPDVEKLPYEKPKYSRLEKPEIKKTDAGFKKPVVKKPSIAKPKAPVDRDWDFVTDEHAAEEFTPLRPNSPEADGHIIFEMQLCSDCSGLTLTEVIDTEEFTPYALPIPVIVEKIKEPEVVVEEKVTPEVVVKKVIPEEPPAPVYTEPEVVEIKPNKPVQEHRYFSGTYKERYQHALALYEQDKHDDAEAEFRLLLAEDDSNSLSDNCQYWIGECQYAKGNYDQAFDEFDKVHDFKVSNKNSDADIMMEKCRRRAGKAPTKRAPVPRTQVVKTPVKSEQKKAPLASETELFGGNDRVLQEITSPNYVPEKKSSSSGIPYQTRYNSALREHENGDFEESIAQFQEMIEDNNEHDLSDNCQYWIGESYYKMGRYDMALVEFERVLEYENTNKNDDALTMIGKSRWKLQHGGNNDNVAEPKPKKELYKPKAQPQKKKLYTSNVQQQKKKSIVPASGYEGRYNQAKELIDVNRRPEALPILKGLLKESKRHNLSDNCQYWIGEIYYESKSYDRALPEFRKVLDEYKNSNKTEDATYMIGRCYHKKNEPNNAIEIYNLFLEVYPESPRVEKVKDHLDRLSP
ncbi:MAG: CHAT domain-containing protein [Calditrichaeota bacterium]|nr:CHAT domain-containing protein [Calditrichota bacterium]